MHVTNNDGTMGRALGIERNHPIIDLSGSPVRSSFGQQGHKALFLMCA
ncbi:MAG TPA: hypothetical protein VE264_06115 [Nitrososphaera sp.]|nr:hypothetical protein [Nitrososphaera sp.]